MRSHVGMRIVALCLVTALNSGCSLALVRGPPEDFRERQEFECTESRVVPFLDIGLGVVAAATVRVESVSPETGESEVQVGQTIALAAIAGGVFAFSSLGGFKSVSACRAAREEANERAGAVFPAAPGWGARFGAPSESSSPRRRGRSLLFLQKGLAAGSPAGVAPHP
jgi:hypothetical protein